MFFDMTVFINFHTIFFRSGFKKNLNRAGQSVRKILFFVIHKMTPFFYKRLNKELVVVIEPQTVNLKKNMIDLKGNNN